MYKTFWAKRRIQNWKLLCWNFVKLWIITWASRWRYTPCDLCHKWLSRPFTVGNKQRLCLIYASRKKNQLLLLIVIEHLIDKKWDVSLFSRHLKKRTRNYTKPREVGIIKKNIILSLLSSIMIISFWECLRK